MGTQRWADQEAVLLPKEGADPSAIAELLPHGELRASFRFLHGLMAELLYDAAHWHQARVGAMFSDDHSNHSTSVAASAPGSSPADQSNASSPHGSGGLLQGPPNSNATTDNPRVFSAGTVRPSEFALLVTREQLVLDYTADNPVTATSLTHSLTHSRATIY